MDAKKVPHEFADREIDEGEGCKQFGSEKAHRRNSETKEVATSHHVRSSICGAYHSEPLSSARPAWRMITHGRIDSSKNEAKNEFIEGIQQLMGVRENAETGKTFNLAALSTVLRVRNRLVRTMRRSSTVQIKQSQRTNASLQQLHIQQPEDASVENFECASASLHQIHDLIKEFGEDELASGKQDGDNSQTPGFDILKWFQEVSKNFSEEPQDNDDNYIEKGVVAPPDPRLNSAPDLKCGISQKAKCQSTNFGLGISGTLDSDSDSDFTDVEDTGSKQAKTKPCLPSLAAVKRNNASAKRSKRQNGEVQEMFSEDALKSVSCKISTPAEQESEGAGKPRRRHTTEAVFLPGLPSVADLVKERAKKEDLLKSLEQLAKKAACKAPDSGVGTTTTTTTTVFRVFPNRLRRRASVK